MCTKFGLLLLFVVYIAGFDSAKPQLVSGSCGENEVFTTCINTCQPRCEKKIAAVCIAILPCIVGCQCQPGYVLNNEERCVLPEDCGAALKL